MEVGLNNNINKKILGATVIVFINERVVFQLKKLILIITVKGLVCRNILLTVEFPHYFS